MVGTKNTDSSSGNSLKLLTDASIGACYQVTSTMSRNATYPKYKMGAGDTALPEDVANKMYDKIADGFVTGTPVFIPHRERDIIKSVDSDLKHGFYRP